jgi:hypothetical protein
MNKKGGHLSSFDSYNTILTITKEQSFFTLKIQEVWIGFNRLDKEKGYQWTDGQPNSYVYWDFGYPTIVNDIEDCVEMRNSYRWRNSFCYTAKRT